jgi:predicted permease
MRSKIHNWLQETHGAGFELLRHFWSHPFESEITSDSSEWIKVVSGVLAALASIGILGLKTYLGRYNGLQKLGRGFYIHGVREDLLTFITLAMALTAVLTLLRWSSLFPSVRDCLALASYPVNPRQIFAAKFTSVVALFAVYVLAISVVPALLFAIVISGPYQENASLFVLASANFAALAGSCAFVFFGLLAFQGVMLHALPGRLFTSASAWLQAVLFMGVIGAIPLLGRQPADAAWWPPVWFVRFWESAAIGAAARTPLVAIALFAAVSVLAYVGAYRRYQRLLLEVPRSRHSGHTGVGTWLLDRWIADPREQGAFAFIWKTLTRSSMHRLILLAYAGVALGWIVKGLLDAPRPKLRDEGMYGLLVILGPLAVSLILTVAIRYLFSLPVTLRANWIYQANEELGRRAWLNATERFVVCCGIAPVFAASAPAVFAIHGPLRAAAALILSFGVSVLWFEALFREWRKMPFACSYLPGQKPAVILLVRYALAAPLLVPISQLVLYSSGDLVAFLALLTFEGVVWWTLRKSRHATWASTGLLFEAVPERDVNALHVPSQSGALSQVTVHAHEQPMFAAGLVGSRGVIPHDWAEEFREDSRNRSMLVSSILEDLRYGFRLVWRNPVLSCVIVLTLTVGIGINASLFTVVNGLALRPHVYKDPDSFVRLIAKSRTQNTVRNLSYDEYVAFRDSTRTVRQLAAYGDFLAMIGDDDSDGSFGLMVSCNFFAVDGIERATLGRLLMPDDCDSWSRIPVAIVSESVWRARFAADPHAIGRMVRINNRPATIVGVVPDRTSNWTVPPGIWVPFTAQPYFDPAHNQFKDPQSLWLWLAGRLKPGYTRSDAENEFEILGRRQDRLNPGRWTTMVAADGSWASELTQSVSGQRLMLLGFFVGAFNLVLFTACANVATLLLSRAAARQREIAVRLSLGAARVRLVRMLVTESVVLAGIAGSISLWLVWRVPLPLYRAVVGVGPDFPMAPDWKIFGYISAVVLLTGVLSGIAPALESLRVDLSGSLKGSASMFGTLVGARTRGLLVSAQVAMSLVLLVGAALFAQAEYRVLHSDPGYLPRKVVVAWLRLPEGTAPANARVRIDTIVQRVRALPGVRSVSFSDGLPMWSRETTEIRPPTRQDAIQPVDIYAASPGFFETLGIRLLRGREFNDSDANAVIVSRSLAKAFWPRQDPIGRQLPLPNAPATVVGVAADVEPMRFGGSDNLPVYRVRHIQPQNNTLMVRFDFGAPGGARAVRAAVHEVAPDLSVMARLMQDWVDRMTEILWNVVSFVLILGLIASVLAGIGIYGAVSFAVRQRARELGIRIALGASKRDIVRQVLMTGGKPIGQGLLVGLWIAVPTAIGLRESLVDSPLRLETGAPLVYCATALFLAAAGLAAMIAPARRGAQSDPCQALRCE